MCWFGEPRYNSSLNSSFDFNTSLGLTKGLVMVFNLNYQSRTVTFQGEQSSFFSPNLSLKKSLPKANLDLALHLRNIGLDFFVFQPAISKHFKHLKEEIGIT